MFCHFLVECVSVSGDLCLSCGSSLGVATVSSLTVDMICDGTAKRINLLKVFVFVACEGQLQVVLW